MLNDAAQILKMIEEVSPDDAAKLDEIDARVWCYLNFHNFAAVKYDRVFVLDQYQCEIEKLNGVCGLKYTRSRDALKAIRPKGWTFRSAYYYPKPDGEYGFVMTNNPANPIEQYQVVGKSYQTEELAELHAIIQAINFERENKNVD